MSRRVKRNIGERLQLFLVKVMSAVSFVLIAFYLGYLVYNTIAYFDFCKALLGCIALTSMIHLNKSL